VKKGNGQKKKAWGLQGPDTQFSSKRKKKIGGNREGGKENHGFKKLWGEGGNNAHEKRKRTTRLNPRLEVSALFAKVKGKRTWLMMYLAEKKEERRKILGFKKKKWKGSNIERQRGEPVIAITAFGRGGGIREEMTEGNQLSCLWDHIDRPQKKGRRADQ